MSKEIFTLIIIGIVVSFLIAVFVGRCIAVGMGSEGKR